MEEYLAFIEEIGRTINGDYSYCFYFTYDTEIVWGEYFNVCPCSIIPNLMPDLNALSTKTIVSFPQKIMLAKNNMCFSMQDCIDGIIPLGFVDISMDDYLKYRDKPLYFPFGENIEDFIKKCNSLNINIADFENVNVENNTEIDNIIDNLDKEDIDDLDF